MLIDDPIAMRDAYASGKVHIGWATLDMIPLFVEQLKKGLTHHAARLPAGRLVERRRRHRRAARTIKSVTDLRGKTVVLAQNSPSHFFLLNTLIAGGLQPS